MYGALSTVNTGAVEVDRHLVGSHLVFLVTTLTIGPDARGSVSLKYLE